MQFTKLFLLILLIVIQLAFGVLRNPYDILGVKRTASITDIKNAYRLLAKKL